MGQRALPQSQIWYVSSIEWHMVRLRGSLFDIQADKEGRATWLGSSNVANRGFYESLGFVVIAQITLGETDPTWNEAPLVSDLVR